MKLELKHLAGYLPYGLKVLHNDFKNHILTMDSCGSESDSLSIEDIEEYARPILHPLSDLSNKYVSQSILDRINECSSKDIKEALNYNSITYLLQIHFDIYGLIENGLAIDINTLDK